MTVKDDCENVWGCRLVLTEESNDRSTSETYPTMAKALQDLIGHSCEPFQLLKIEGCGSDANMYAINSITNMCPQECAVACGSYLSGDHGPLQSRSSSVFYRQDLLTMISLPNQCSEKAQETTLPFPYFISGCNHCFDGCIRCNSEQLEREELETLCLREIHIRIILSLIKGPPIKAIIMELMLAGSGATLSHKFLIALSFICGTFEIYLVVDEVMTAGRNNTMLMTRGTPQEFINRVAYVTMGKWPGVGMVLEQPSITLDYRGSDDYRGTSTFISIQQTYNIVKAVTEKICFAEERRLQFLAKHNLDPHECWGIGTIIFSPMHRVESKQGLKCRMLPLLEDIRFRPFQRIHDANISKEIIGKVINQTVKQWIAHSRSYTEGIDRNLCLLLSSQTNFSGKTASEYKVLFRKIMAKEYNLENIILTMHNWKDSGLVTLTALSRKEGFSLQSEMDDQFIILPVGTRIKYDLVKLNYAAKASDSTDLLTANLKKRDDSYQGDASWCAAKNYCANCEAKAPYMHRCIQCNHFVHKSGCCQHLQNFKFLCYFCYFQNQKAKKEKPNNH